MGNYQAKVELMLAEESQTLQPSRGFAPPMQHSTPKPYRPV